MDKQKPPVMIIASSLATQLSLRRILRSSGYMVYCVGTGKAAIDFLRAGQTPPRVIILNEDISVADLALFREFQKHEDRLRDIPLIRRWNEGEFLSLVEQFCR